MVVKDIKRLGFRYATQAGITVSAMDIPHPESKWQIIHATEKEVAEVERMYRRGVMTEDERYRKVIELWQRAYEQVGNATELAFDKFSPIWMMMGSGARGNIQQIRQLAGMRGLMADPTGRIIDLPIMANFTEGLTVREYVIAAQSIGEPGTQLTMRTFHTGGVAGVDITQGLPRVEELFEARIPKGKAIISEIDGELEIIRQEGTRKVRVISREEFEVSYPVDPKMTPIVKSKDDVMEGQELARDAKGNAVRTRHAGKVTVSTKEVTVRTLDEELREYAIPHQVRIRPELDRRDGQKVFIKAGQQITEGSISPQELLHILGKEAVQTFLVDEVQKVYRSQGVDINDKHIEVIVRQRMRKGRVDSAGDTGLLRGEISSLWVHEDADAKV